MNFTTVILLCGLFIQFVQQCDGNSMNAVGVLITRIFSTAKFVARVKEIVQESSKDEVTPSELFCKFIPAVLDFVGVDYIPMDEEEMQQECFDAAQYIGFPKENNITQNIVWGRIYDKKVLKVFPFDQRIPSVMFEEVKNCLEIPLIVVPEGSYGAHYIRQNCVPLLVMNHLPEPEARVTGTRSRLRPSSRASSKTSSTSSNGSPSSAKKKKTEQGKNPDDVKQTGKPDQKNKESESSRNAKASEGHDSVGQAVASAPTSDNASEKDRNLKLGGDKSKRNATSAEMETRSNSTYKGDPNSLATHNSGTDKDYKPPSADISDGGHRTVDSSKNNVLKTVTSATKGVAEGGWNAFLQMKELVYGLLTLLGTSTLGAVVYCCRKCVGRKSNRDGKNQQVNSSIPMNSFANPYVSMNNTWGGSGYLSQMHPMNTNNYPSIPMSSMWGGHGQLTELHGMNTSNFSHLPMYQTWGGLGHGMSLGNFQNLPMNPPQMIGAPFNRDPYWAYR